MANSNFNPDAERVLDTQHELRESSESAEAAAEELRQVKAERDALLERLSRAQAEFEDARKRAAGNSRSSGILPWRTRSIRCCPSWIASSGPCVRRRRTWRNFATGSS
jgi:hypothetical protein